MEEGNGERESLGPSLVAAGSPDPALVNAVVEAGYGATPLERANDPVITPGRGGGND